MIGIRDQFEVEPRFALSAAMSSRILQGSIFDNTNSAGYSTLFPPYPISTLGRIRTGDHSTGSVYLFNAITSGESVAHSIFYSEKKHYNLGYNNRYSLHYCNSEYYYDSIVPNPFLIYRQDGGKFVYSTLDATNSIDSLSQSVQQSTKLVLGYPDLNVTASSPESSLYPLPNTQISDNDWLYSCPFERKYSSIARTFGFPSLGTTNEFLEVAPTTGNQLLYNGYSPISASALNQISLEFLVYSSSGDPPFGYQTSSFITYTVTEKYSAVALDANGFPALNSLKLGTYPGTSGTFSSLLYKHFFGIGDGFRNQILFDTVNASKNSFLSTSYFIGQSSNVRGWKYGLYNAFPTQTKIIFSRKHYGYMRDMLEQRPYTKFYDPLGITDDGITGGKIGVKLAGIQATFVSGSNSFITASNFSLNPTESGIYDTECKSTKYFFDISATTN